MQNVIEELKRIQAAVTNLIEVLESSPENKTVSATVGEIRSVAILEEIYQCSGSVTPEQISQLLRRILLREKTFLKSKR